MISLTFPLLMIPGFTLWDDWCDTDVPDNSGDLPPEDGEAESPCPCSPDEAAMPARLHQNSLCSPDFSMDIDPKMDFWGFPVIPTCATVMDN